MILGRGTAGARRVWPAGVLAGFQVALLGLGMGTVGALTEPPGGT